MTDDPVGARAPKQHDEKKGDTHVDSLRLSAQQATGGQITLIRTDVVRDLLLYLDHTADRQWEAIAEKFYRETGFLRPGKSVPMEMWTEDHDRRRKEAWATWCAQWKARLVASLSAGLPSAREAGCVNEAPTVPDGENKNG